MSTSIPRSSRPLWIFATCFSIAVLFLLFGYGRQAAPSTWHANGKLAAGHILYDDIRNATLGFQNIFAINLPSRTDHRDSMALAAHFSGLQVDFIDGVTEVDEKTIPPHDADFDMHDGGLRAWRAHLNIARTMVEQNIASALVLEDDADWDLRIKDQMQQFANASRLLLQPQSRSTTQSNIFLDPTNPRTSVEDQPRDFTFDDGPVIAPTTSPYGDLDMWDILWVGHCGTRFPIPDNKKVPLGRVTYPDETIPEPQHVKIQFGNDELIEKYPPHTRAVHRVAANVCTLAYGITLPGARRLLYELSINRISSSTDLMMSWLCEGLDGRKLRTCLSVQPQLFNHHRPVGSKAGQSDIAPHPDEFNEVAFSKNIRWSTRVNFPKLVDGEEDWVDTFPDGAEPVDYGF